MASDDDVLTPEEKKASKDEYMADDVQAEADAETGVDSDNLKEQDDLEVTSGEMKIGDLDDDPEEKQGSEDSYDEESVPGSDNVSDN
jgi:hypothetical protein